MAPVPVSFPNDPEGAPGPLHSGTGDGREAGALELVELRRGPMGMRGVVQIESEGTVHQRGQQLPAWIRYQMSASSSPVPRCKGPGPPSTI